MASVAEPPLPSASSLPPASRAARSAPAAASSASRFSLSVCARSAPISSAFISTERRTSSSTGSSSFSCSSRNGYRKLEAPASWSAARVAALEQPAVLEEHVHELPEHVVERLDQLLADEAVAGRRRELPLGAARAEADRQAAAAPRSGQRPRRLAAVLVGAEGDRDVVAAARSARPAAPARRPRRSARAPAGRACRRSPGARTRPPRAGRPSAPRASARTRSAGPPGRTARP